jgi:Na+/proline symporter
MPPALVQNLPIIVIGIYLAVVLYIGIFAFRKGKSTGEDFFLASRSIGSIVFFLSLFATNMTAFAIIGSSGMAYKQGIGVFGLMASSSGFVIPLTLFVIGTRLWALGRRFGHMTQVSYFRDRWDCSFIGTVIFALTAAMMIPYLIISIIGGGVILETLTDGRLSFAVSGAIVAIVVMGNVFFGGLRGAVLVNVFQTILFLSFGLIAFLAIGHKIDFGQTVQTLSSDPIRKFLLTRDNSQNISTWQFFSYIFIPLSSIMFPHMSIMCLTAKKVTAFKKTVVLYPLCIMAIWLPCVFLGAIAINQPEINAAMAAGSEPMKKWLEHPTVAGEPSLIKAMEKVPAGAALRDDIIAKNGSVTAKEFATRLPEVVKPLPPNVKGPIVREVGILAKGNSDSVLLNLLKVHIKPWLAGLLAAGIISAVMGSDCHQILALSTMFTKDIFDHYGGSKRFGERGTIIVGRTFIIVANLIAYVIALSRPPIFDLAIAYAFSGFASLAPIMLAALFWKRSTKYGALLATLVVAAGIIATGLLEHSYAPKISVVPPVEIPIWSLAGHIVLSLNKGGKLMVWGLMPVVPMILGSTLAVIFGSLLTSPPSRKTIARYFPDEQENALERGFEPVGIRA